jgi:hypothetical protein
MDNRSLLPGTKFDEAMLTAVQRSQVLLVVVGVGWLNARDASGQQLVDRRQDWVRREIATAFRSQTTVVPVLVDHTMLLRQDDLPASIRRLATCQYIRLRHGDSRRDLSHLLNLMRRLIPARETAGPSR